MRIRLPEGVRDRIAALASANGRSMNAEIVAAVEAWLDKEEALHKAPKRDAYNELLDLMEQLGRVASLMPPTLFKLAIESGRVKVVDEEDKGESPDRG